MSGNYAERGRIPDFSGYPDLVVMYLGMRVRALRGLKMLIGLGPEIGSSGAARPDGLLHCENNIIYKLYPLEMGMRWYWRDIASLETYSRSEPHRTWWQNYVRDAGGVGIWHETYHMRGGMEAIFVDLPDSSGLGAFMPMQGARGSMVSRHVNHRTSDLSHLPAVTPTFEPQD